MTDEKALVAVLMGSESDWETMKHSVQTLEQLGIPCEQRIRSSQRTPDLVLKYSVSAESPGLKAIICAGLGGAQQPRRRQTICLFWVPLRTGPERLRLSCWRCRRCRAASCGRAGLDRATP
jgi:hypothetical protein